MEPQASERLQKILAQSNSVSQLDQLCGLFGWGRKLFYDAEAGWVAEVICGVDDVYKIESQVHQPRTKKGEKTGRAAVAKKAVATLQPLAASCLAKAAVTLEDVSAGGVQLEILESCPSSWSRFWEAVHSLEESHKGVGVGTEGNNGSGPPIFVQVAVQNLVIIELPRSRPNMKISTDMEKLLADETITKVFCDSVKHRDIESLGLSHTSPGVVNLEEVAVERFGKPSGLRGLATIFGMLLGVRVSKGDPSAWKEIEEHENPRSLADFSSKALRYAATEAHSALGAWHSFQKLSTKWRKPAIKVQLADRDLKRAAVPCDAADPNRIADEDPDAELNAIDNELIALEAQLRALDGVASGGEKKMRVARKRKRQPLNASQRKWVGWRSALDDELRAAGGRLPWKKLRDALVARYYACTGADSVSKQELETEALASIPDSYLNRRTSFVKLP